MAKNKNLEKINDVIFGKIFEFFWKNGEKDKPFFQKISKEIHQIPNFGSGALSG